MMQTVEPIFFQFEADFVDSLRCIPMVVRYKLDTCGIKLKLNQWHEMSASVRQQLVTLPCTTAAETAVYQQQVSTLLWECCQTAASRLPIEEHPPWLDETTIPPSVQIKAQTLAASLSLAQWQALTPLQRFALIKLSRSSHENRNFLPALTEFQG
jgi:hypothetical protein